MLSYQHKVRNCLSSQPPNNTLIRYIRHKNYQICTFYALTERKIFRIHQTIQQQKTPQVGRPVVLEMSKIRSQLILEVDSQTLKRKKT